MGEIGPLGGHNGLKPGNGGGVFAREVVVGDGVDVLLLVKLL